VLPTLDDSSCPPTALLLHYLSALAADGADTIRLDYWPHGNAVLPELCELAGITRIECDVAQRGHDAWWWLTSSGGRIAVGDADDTAPSHSGPVATSSGVGHVPRRGILAALEAARLQDASAAVCAGGKGADWDTLGKSLEQPRLLPSATTVLRPGLVANDGTWSAWNPLPLARRCLVHVPGANDHAPAACSDPDQGLHPVQSTDGAFGEEWLCSLPLPSLDAITLQRHDQATAGAHWQVDERCLDNGRVRAEIDGNGLIARLCIDGRFANLTGPLLQPLRNGHVLPRADEIEILENGPVRARVVCTFSDDQDGVLRLTYSLDAHQGHLRIGATWAGERPAPILRHHTGWRDESVIIGHDAIAHRQDQRPSLRHPNGAIAHGIRHLSLGGDGFHCGLGLASAMPLTVRCRGGIVDVPIDGTCSYVIGDSQRREHQLGLGPLAHSLALPARCTPPFTPERRLEVLGHGITPLWVGPDHDGCRVLLANDGEQHRRCWLRDSQDHGATPAIDAIRIDGQGRPLGGRGPVIDDDAWRLDLPPHSLLLIRC
jgi:hypothetical protein